MHALLLAVAVTIPCWYAYRRSVAHGLLEINHVTTFTFGFLFYWITPLAVRILAPHVDFPLARIWSGLFREHLIVPYAVSCIALYLCFMLGDSLAVHWFRRRPSQPARTIPTFALSLIMAFGCLLLLYSVYVVRADLFRPVAPGMNEVGAARGAVTACVVLLGCVALMFTLERPQIPWRKLLVSRYFLPPILGGGMMLLLGSRLYVASLVVIFLVCHTNFRSRFRLKRMLAAAVLFAIFFGAVGTWREGSSPTGAFFNIFLEPMEGSLSLVHHLRYRGIAWTNQPTQLLSDFENLVPTVLMPEKYKMLRKPDAYRPLGGLNSFVSFNLNFGLLGTAVFWLLWPMMFRYFKSRSAGTLAATIYVMCSGWLAFTFFRDPFSISLVKAILEQSIIIPFLIVCFGRLLSAACSPVDGRILLPPAQPEGA